MKVSLSCINSTFLAGTNYCGKNISLLAREAQGYRCQSVSIVVHAFVSIVVHALLCLLYNMQHRKLGQHIFYCLKITDVH